MAATRGCSSLPRWLSSCTVHQASARFRLPFLKLHYCAYLCALCGCFVAASIEGAPHATEHRAHTAQCAWHHRSAQRTRLCGAVLCCAVLCCAVFYAPTCCAYLGPAVCGTALSPIGSCGAESGQRHVTRCGTHSRPRDMQHAYLWPRTYQRSAGYCGVRHTIRVNPMSVPFGTDCTLTLASTGRSGTVGYQSGWGGPHC